MHNRLFRVISQGRYFLANIVRFLMSPIQQKTVPVEIVRTIFGCGYSENAWNYLKQTLLDYEKNPNLDIEQTDLYRYLFYFSPSGIADLVAVEADLPLFVYPWGTFAHGKTVSEKDPFQSRFCGPSSPQFIREEYTRTIKLYLAIKDVGYSPYRYPNSFIEGVWLISMSGEERFIVMQGNHRMAALTAMGKKEVKVKTMHCKYPKIYEKDSKNWLLVKNGIISELAAMKVFNYFFNENGWSIAKKIARHDAICEK